MRASIGEHETYKDNSTYLWRHVVRQDDVFVCNRKDFTAVEWARREELMAEMKKAAAENDLPRVEKLEQAIAVIGKTTPEGRFANSSDAVNYFRAGYDQSPEHAYRAHMFVAQEDPTLGPWVPDP